MNGKDSAFWELRVTAYAGKAATYLGLPTYWTCRDLVATPTVYSAQSAPSSNSAAQPGWDAYFLNVLSDRFAWKRRREVPVPRAWPEVFDGRRLAYSEILEKGCLASNLQSFRRSGGPDGRMKKRLFEAARG